MPLHGMLMEVSENEYCDFYKNRRRQKYLKEESLRNGEISYDMLNTEAFNGEEILVDLEQDVAKLVEQKVMTDKLYEAIELLTPKERELIQAIFFDKMSEREYAKQKGVYSNAVHKKKKRIVEKLKKL